MLYVRLLVANGEYSVMADIWSLRGRNKLDTRVLLPPGHGLLQLVQRVTFNHRQKTTTISSSGHNGYKLYQLWQPVSQLELTEIVTAVRRKACVDLPWYDIPRPQLAGHLPLTSRG